MSIESKHAYRFGFLKSERWDQIRLDVLVRQNGKCFICKTEAWNNDVHHVSYPKDWRHPTINRQLIVLCRDCHEFVHAALDRSRRAKPAARWRMMQLARDVVSGLASESWSPQAGPVKPTVSTCRCCEREVPVVRRNILKGIGDTWDIPLCDSCFRSCVDYVERSHDQMCRAGANRFRMLKAFFKTLRIKDGIDKVGSSTTPKE